MARRGPSPKALYFTLLALLALSALLPTNFLTRWFVAFRDPALAIIAPVSSLGSFVSTRIRPAHATGDVDTSARPFDAEYEDLMHQLRLALDRNEALRRQVEALQGIAPFEDPSTHRKVAATRTGSNPSAGTIDVKAGEREGVTLSTIATAAANPSQIVGIVVRAGRLVSTVHLLTDRSLSPGLIEGVIIPPGVPDRAALQTAPRCQLTPTGDGRLVADQVGVSDAAPIERGHLVLLSDPNWPQPAQLLVIGRVVRVDETEQPLFRRVTVEPEVNLARVREVVLRIPTSHGEGGGGG